MRKSIVFLSFVAAIAMWSCGGKNTQSEGECQDSADMKQECQKECADKDAILEKWAKFDSLTVEEQEALLAKRAECFAKKKAAAESEMSASMKKVMTEVDAEWAKFEKMTIAEKKAFFDKVYELMTKAKGDECANAEKKECSKGKACCKDGGKKECSKDGGKKECCNKK